MTVHIDKAHLSENWLRRVDHLICNASFAKNRYRVQRVYVVAKVLSQDEAEIRELLATMPFFSVTQENLDWQPEDQLSHGGVFQHLLRMGAEEASRSQVLPTLLEDVESSEFPVLGESDNPERFYRQSFRLSSLEVCNAPGDTSLGYHIGATAFQKLTDLRDSDDSDENWRNWLIEYIVKHDVESPRIVWARDGRVMSAVLWQVQLDILDSSYPRPSSSCSKRRRRSSYGHFLQVPDSPDVEDASEDVSLKAKVDYRGVRHRPNRKSWVAETRLPNKMKRNKVSFGDFKSPDQAACAVDAAFYHYGKHDLFNFVDSPKVLSTNPLPPGLNEEEKLKLVKERGKWLATTMAPTWLTGSPSSVTPEMIPDPTSSCGHRALSSEATAFTDDDEARLEDPVELNETMTELFSEIISGNSDLHEIFSSLENENFSRTDYDPFEISASSPPTASTFDPMKIDSCRDLWE